MRSCVGRRYVTEGTGASPAQHGLVRGTTMQTRDGGGCLGRGHELHWGHSKIKCAPSNNLSPHTFCPHISTKHPGHMGSSSWAPHTTWDESGTSSNAAQAQSAWAGGMERGDIVLDGLQHSPATDRPSQSQ